MAELLSFSKGHGKIPAFALLELQAGQSIQVYDVRLKITARFRGLRWWMYNHRILSALVGTAVFWGSSLTVTLLSWVILRLVFSTHDDSSRESIKGEEPYTTPDKIKDEIATDEEPDLSDTPRTFPTYGRQAPLRYEPKIKNEPAESEEYILEETAIQPLTTAEADDEEDDDLGGDYRGVDSGLGTSYSESGGRSSVARRRSKGKGGGS
jgi:hypothetical protein